MHYYEVAPNRIARTGEGIFTYHCSRQLPIGIVVEIPLGTKTVVGVVMAKTDQPTYATKEITRIIEDTPLPEELVQLASWLSQYYATPLATVLQTILPRGVDKTRRARKDEPLIAGRQRTNFRLNSQQQLAVDKIISPDTTSALLHGITGSGKTAVYIEVVKRTLAAGKSAILLVPEIALTSQVVAEFSQHFDNIILTHSRQTEAERHLAWKQALDSVEPRVIIGPRSALFLPLKNLGVILIDEAHEPTFKQEQSPRYSALRAASILGEFHAAKVVFGSATPSVADYYLAEFAGKPILELTERARPEAVSPNVSLLDMTKRSNFKSHRFLSDELIKATEQTLAEQKQVLIFHNRRGSASSTLCENCGWIAGCPQCFVPLTLHADKHHLRCHVCGLSSHVPTSCPECGEVDIIHKGIGTKLIESELRKIFTQANIARFDGDSDQSVDKLYNDIYAGKIDIIIGTQVIAKGLDLPHLRTVGVVQADAGLSLPDYSSSERTFQLLAQVIGRVGRSHHATTVIVQSYQPGHPSITAGLAQDYRGFYNYALADRKRSNFPPFCYLLKLTCVYKTEASAVRNSQKLARELKTNFKTIEVLGPTPSFYERVGDTYRWQLIIKSRRRADLLEILHRLPTSHWQYELDPASLL